MTNRTGSDLKTTAFGSDIGPDGKLEALFYAVEYEVSITQFNMEEAIVARFLHLAEGTGLSGWHVHQFMAIVSQHPPPTLARKQMDGSEYVSLCAALRAYWLDLCGKTLLFADEERPNMRQFLDAVGEDFMISFGHHYGTVEECRPACTQNYVEFAYQQCCYGHNFCRSPDEDRVDCTIYSNGSSEESQLESDEPLDSGRENFTSDGEDLEENVFYEEHFIENGNVGDALETVPEQLG